MLGLPIEEREMIVDLVQKLRLRMLTQEKILELDDSQEFPEDIIRELLGPDIGLQYVFIPEEHGGMGGGARDIAVVSEELAKICLGIATAFLAIHLGADPLIMGGTKKQKDKWLGKIAEEGSIVAYAVTEPDAGSNLSSLKTKAVPIKDDSGQIVEWEITGNKQFISNGGYADFLTVLADTPDGPSFFVVEKGTPGFKPGKHEEKHGIRCSNTSPIVFDKVKVPAAHLIGEVPGEGLKQANAVFGYTRLMVAAFGLGAGVEAIDRAIKYAKERVQFGSTLFEKPGYTHKLIVPNWVNMEAARAYIEAVATMIDSGETDTEVEGAIAKYIATETGNQAAEQAIQAFGGYGYIHEYEVEKIKRDVRITTIYEGTSEIQQMIIGTFRWRKTVRKKGAFYEDIALELDAIHEQKPDIAAGFFAHALRTLNILIQKMHKVRKMKHQHVLFTLAHLIAYVEVGSALVKKAAAPEKAGSKSAKRLELSARIFAVETMNILRNTSDFVLLGTDAYSLEEGSRILADLDLNKARINLSAIQDMDELVKLL